MRAATLLTCSPGSYVAKDREGRSDSPWLPPAVLTLLQARALSRRSQTPSCLGPFAPSVTSALAGVLQVWPTNNHSPRSHLRVRTKGRQYRLARCKGTCCPDDSSLRHHKWLFEDIHRLQQ